MENVHSEKHQVTNVVSSENIYVIYMIVLIILHYIMFLMYPI